MKSKKLLVLLLAIVIVAMGAYYGSDLLKQQSEETRVLRWAGDSYAGYSILRSGEMQKQVAKSGMSLAFTNDNGDYKSRLEKFANQEYDFIVLPVNSYIEHGAHHDFPGAIVAAISESNGADAIVASPDIFSSGSINDLNNADLSWYYTPNSPSSFLIDLTIADFGLDKLQADRHWKNEVMGSAEVYALAVKSVEMQKKGELFVLWEPHVSKAVNELGLKKVWGSDKFDEYIIDVIVFHNSCIVDEAKTVSEFLRVYFNVVDYYSEKNDEFLGEVSRLTSVEENTEEMLSQIDFYDLLENCVDLFGIKIHAELPAKEGIANCIHACKEVLLQNGTLYADESISYRLSNNSFLSIIKDGVKEDLVSHHNAHENDFVSIDDQQWNTLTVIGMLQNEPITFTSGSTELSEESRTIIDKMALLLLNNYPYYRIQINGHTSKEEQKQLNSLSTERARAVEHYLLNVHGLDPDRIRTAGLGSDSLPRKKLNETPEDYLSRVARVEFVLLADDPI